MPGDPKRGEPGFHEAAAHAADNLLFAHWDGKTISAPPLIRVDHLTVERLNLDHLVITDPRPALKHSPACNAAPRVCICTPRKDPA